jgi:agmatinase
MNDSNIPSDNFKGFLHSEIGVTHPADSFFHIIPALFEKSVSYGTGTSKGPLAILKASQQLELFDGKGIPARRGIFTQAPLVCAKSAEQGLMDISAAVSRVLSHKRFPILLGGEHTVTLGALGAIEAQGDLKEKIGVVQFDAHADLRNTYQENTLSHACVMRRTFEMGFPIYQIGVRSLCSTEAEFRQGRNIGCYDAEWIAKNGIPNNILPHDFPQSIYITIDVDVLDPSIMPATGTPEPGGLNWYQLMDALKRVMAGRQVIGFDVVELAPIEGFNAPNYTCARLIYNLMGMIKRIL